MNLHDWIDELSDLLDVETEADEALLGDLADIAVENVDHHAGPVTTFLLGVAAGARNAGPDAVEKLAARVQALAEAWDRPADAVAADDDEVEVEIDDLAELDLEEEEESETEDAVV
ncbi:DUF6457 domain-containing protein [Nocardioides panacisoli]|uniref:DUF6457 domain-containing protein n=1 Tax=Nocardioides panacisoli TaxID=627624 RepID=A0ABP7II25_9ACTN